MRSKSLIDKILKEAMIIGPDGSISEEGEFDKYMGHSPRDFFRFVKQCALTSPEFKNDMAEQINEFDGNMYMGITQALSHLIYYDIFNFEYEVENPLGYNEAPGCFMYETYPENGNLWGAIAYGIAERYKEEHPDEDLYWDDGDEAHHNWLRSKGDPTNDEDYEDGDEWKSVLKPDLSEDLLERLKAEHLKTLGNDPIRNKWNKCSEQEENFIISNGPTDENGNSRLTSYIVWNKYKKRWFIHHRWA